MSEPTARYVAGVYLDGEHRFGKVQVDGIELVTGRGVRGDAHYGVTVQHRSRVARDPTAPNLRQVHLIHGELYDELAGAGFPVRPGDLGENITTRGVDVLALPVGTLLRLGADAVVELTGLRNPCRQIDELHRGLLAAVLDRDAAGRMIRKAGVMAVVRTDGAVCPDDPIALTVPAPPHRLLEPV